VKLDVVYSQLLEVELEILVIRNLAALLPNVGLPVRREYSTSEFAGQRMRNAFACFPVSLRRQTSCNVAFSLDARCWRKTANVHVIIVILAFDISNARSARCTRKDDFRCGFAREGIQPRAAVLRCPVDQREPLVIKLGPAERVDMRFGALPREQPGIGRNVDQLEVEACVGDIHL
jgi:hypothetical protein